MPPPEPAEATPPGSADALLDRTEALVAVPSVSRAEAPLVDRLHAELLGIPGLAVERIGDNLVARTELGRARRVVLAGHTDTVPADDNATPRRDGDVLWGVGSADMKGGLAVMLELAHHLREPRHDVTWVLYAREEVAAAESGLQELVDTRPDLLRGDVAVLGEPTGGDIEAGCQGTLRVRVTLTGARAHTARPWMGRNAIHRLAPLLAAIEAAPTRRPVLAGCEYREALQAVRVEGGVAGNVVPDRVELVLNHRYAPDRDGAAALDHLHALLLPYLEEGDTVVLDDDAPSAPPGLDHPLLAELAGLVGGDVRAKLGWTDVARFAALGVPAVNLGPGDATLAHTADEHVGGAALVRVYEALRAWLAPAG